MTIGAVIAVGLAVLVGTLLLADLPPGAGLGGSIALHVTTALLATSLVCAVAVGNSGLLAGTALAVLVGAVGLGIRLYRRVARAVEAKSVVPPDGIERRVSPALLVVHGAAAGAAVVLTLLVVISR